MAMLDRLRMVLLTYTVVGYGSPGGIVLPVGMGRALTCSTAGVGRVESAGRAGCRWRRSFALLALCGMLAFNMRMTKGLQMGSGVGSVARSAGTDGSCGSTYR